MSFQKFLGVFVLVLVILFLGACDESSATKAYPNRSQEAACYARDIRGEAKTIRGNLINLLKEHGGRVIRTEGTTNSCGRKVFVKIYFRSCSDEIEEWCRRMPYCCKATRSDMKGPCMYVLTIG